MKEEFGEAAKAVGFPQYDNKDNRCRFEDCGHFAATVIRYSGVDPEFGSADSMIKYMKESSIYEEVENKGSESNLKAGDIFVVSAEYNRNHLDYPGGITGDGSHILIYLGDMGGQFKIADAALGRGCGSPPKEADGYSGKLGVKMPDVDQYGMYVSGARGPYHIFRAKSKGNTSTTKQSTTEKEETKTGGGASAIVEAAKRLSWPEGQRPSDILFSNDEYTKIAKEYGGKYITNTDCDLSELYGEGHGGLEVCPSCARFASMVISESGVDSKFTEESKKGKVHFVNTGSDGLITYLKDSSDWKEVEDYDGRGYDGLIPGDILITGTGYRPDHIKVAARYSEHVFVYLGDGKVAEASNKSAGGWQHDWIDWNNDGFVAFRYASGNCVDSNVTWEDGWIVDGIEGYERNPSSTQDDLVWQSDYITNSPKSGTVGPNKITMHTVEGVLELGENTLYLFRTGEGEFPPHFTIDIKRKHIWQHFPITKPATAIIEHDQSAGVQIEMMGFSSPESAADHGRSDWVLSDTANFSSDDWAYLGELLRAISAETGIPLTISVDTDNPSKLSVSDFEAYEGMIGHIHAPDNDHGDPWPNVWPFIREAIEGSAVCGNNDNDKSKVCEVKEESSSNKSWTGDFPVWDQRDTRWGGHQIPPCVCGSEETGFYTGDIACCGCGIVSFAMMATVLTGTTHEPVEVANAVMANGLMSAVGSSWSLPTDLADQFGLVAESISRDEATVSGYLRKGYMVWTCGANVPGLFSGGHCIGIRGVTDDGKWLLADSGNTANMNIPWEPQDVLRGVLQNDYGGTPMVALKKKGT